MLITGGQIMTNMITLLFNKTLQAGLYPHAWGEGVITSLFKSGDINSTNNYRGITISSCLGKLFNSILNRRLDVFSIENELKCKEQIAYESGSRTVDHIFVLQTLTNQYFSKKDKFYGCFVDMKKAFDSVLHNAILYKLFEENVNGKFHEIITNMYETTKISVKVNQQEKTESFPCKVGIRQGDNLSPNLFKFIMKDLPRQLENAESDPLIFRPVPSHSAG